MKTYRAVGMLMLVCVAFMVNGQANDTLIVRWKKAMAENDEYIHALLAADRNVLENAKVLIHNIVTKQKLFNEMAQYHSDEIGRG